MRFIVPLLFCFFYCNSSYAIYPKKLDSLLIEIQKPEISDKVELKILGRLMFHYTYSNSDSAIMFGSKLIAVSQKQGNYKYLHRGLHYMTIVLTNRLKFDSAHYFANWNYQLTLDKKDSIGNTDVLIDKGNIMQELGFWKWILFSRYESNLFVSGSK